MDPPHYEVIVVGAGIAGTSVVNTLTQLDPNLKIALISPSPILKMARTTALTTGRLQEVQLDLQHASSLQNGATFIQDEVSSFCPKLKRIFTKGSSGGTPQVISYNKLCFCTGAQPSLIAPGNPYVMGLRDTDSVEQLQVRLKEARTVCLVGNGGIASELVHQLTNCHIHWIMRDDSVNSTFLDAIAGQFMLPIVKKDDDRTISTGSRVEGMTLRKSYIVDSAGPALGPDWTKDLILSGSGSRKEVTFHFKTEVASILNQEEAVSSLGSGSDEFPVIVSLTTGETIGCDVVISATGVKPDSDPFTRMPPNVEPSQWGARITGNEGTSHDVNYQEEEEEERSVHCTEQDEMEEQKKGLEPESEQEEPTGKGKGKVRGKGFERVVQPENKRVNLGGEMGREKRQEEGEGEEAQLGENSTRGAGGDEAGGMGFDPNPLHQQGEVEEGTGGIVGKERESWLWGQEAGIGVNYRLQTACPDVYAAGDVCSSRWDLDALSPHWIQMRLWTQAHHMGVFAARSIWSDLNGDSCDAFFPFDVFTHVTQFFGKKVILLGLFNGQGIDKYKVLLRVKEGEELIKVIVKDGRVQGATLIGETDLEETIENLINSQIDISSIEDQLLDNVVDIEDYFD